jgi:protein-tyrosine phosphatase
VEPTVAEGVASGQTGAVPTPRPSVDAAPDGGAFHVIFVCTGNICRSPMGDVVLRHLAADRVLDDGTVLADRLEVASAGTGGWHHGEPMDPRARAALERRGYADHGHRARAFDTAWLPGAGLVVCMDRGHRQTLASMARAKAGDYRYDDRLVLMRSFGARAGGDPDVPDPYYGEDAEFERCLDLVEAGCSGLAEHLVPLVGPTADPGHEHRHSPGSGG